MYQVEPVGVVVPRDGDDVQAALEVARKHRVAVLPRGGGTSLTGQTVNHALVLDFSRFMNNVLEVSEEELWARVQPGLVQDELNHHVRSLGLLFGPDTSTSNRATIGGMLGNNSGGSHSIAYGLTVEHVIELTALLGDGSRVVFGEVTPEGFRAKMRASGLEGQIYREVARLRDQYAGEIRARYPKHWRRVCGYNLDELVRGRPLTMARVIVGSEGTLVTIREAKMRLVKRPKATAVDVIHYHDMQEALESSQTILETGPYAVELTDKMILDLARGNIEQSQRMGFVQGDPAAILIVEYAGDTAAEVKSKVEALEARRAAGRFGYAGHVALDPAEQQSIWKLRKAGLGLLLGTKGEAKPIAFVEDTAVDPKDLPEFVPRFRDIMAKHGAEGAYYGHCSVGCLHIRPVINLKTQRGLDQVEAMAGDIFDLVMEYGVGVCRKKLEGTMCPSYMATRDEEHSTRGRANALRAVLSGTVPAADFAGKRLYEVMDLCLECKGCKAECPSNVDMAKMKYEFLNHYHSVNGLPLRNRLFGHIARLSRWGARLAPLSNWIAASWPNRVLMERLAGIDRRRPLPAFARQTFTDWFARRPPRAEAPRGPVVLFHDTFVTYNTPEIGRAAVELLEAAGHRVELVDKVCCGRPLISKGMLGLAKSHAEYNVARLHPWVARGVPIVGLEPSCLLTLRDEYVDLLRSEEARQVARSSFLLEEFLLREAAHGLTLPWRTGVRRALLHGHCHQKALVGTAPTVAALAWAGFEVTEVDSGCCGMAGSFGFETEHYDISVALGNRRLAPAVKSAPADTAVIAPGISCRQQIQHLTGRRAKHPAEGLRDALLPRS